MNALVALTERVVRSTFRDLDLVFALVIPVATFLGFTVALRSLIDTGDMSYPQYVLPAVIMQSILFGALTTADRAAREQAGGFGIRLRTFPIPVGLPLLARMIYCLLRGVLALAVAIGIAYVFGFRMAGGFGYGVAFVVVVLVLTLALSLGADATGTRIRQTDVSSQLLLIPQLLLVLLSTGMAPVDSFPGWIQPFVQYQPVSTVTETLRGLSTGDVVGANVVLSAGWCVVLLFGCGAIALRMQRRVE
ncbi:ABC transporter permease [Mycolicibacterium arenosum]|uniref:Transport permease protein n=1 Tax=Mycolicibacterium arenosum TaxID=2952157 RepID=A0ABT1M351_9MYCO|nr:ABC transporter permease [Mycolicibacterium sp. CAU 1645]MCP9272684.1 ABC transporter permease [Mycolicibacterium sp. CAU 1645]